MCVIDLGAATAIINLAGFSKQGSLAGGWIRSFCMSSVSVEAEVGVALVDDDDDEADSVVW